MMLWMTRVFGLLAVFYLCYLLFVWLFRPVGKKQKKKVRDLLTKEKQQIHKERLYYFKDVVIARLSKKIFLSENTRSEYENLIKRLDLNTTPEEIRALQVALFIGFTLVAGLIFYVNTVLGVISLLAPFLGWLYPVDEMEKKVEQRNQNIMSDFPQFYSLLYYQYARSVHIYLADVVMDFLPNANADMAKELEILLDNVEYGEDYALKQFKKRISLRYVIRFCDIMQTRINGYDNTAQMGYLKNELDGLRLVRLEKELQKRENKNVRAQFVLLLVLGLYVVAYFYFQFMDAIRLFS
jgi:hypothetical protein